MRIAGENQKRVAALEELEEKSLCEYNQNDRGL